MRARIACACVGLALLAAGLGAAPAGAAFGFRPGPEGFSVAATKLDGTTATQAGSHPYELSLDVNLDQVTGSPGQPGVPFPDGDLKDLRLELPDGLIGNPTVIARCTLAQFTTPRSSPFEAARSGESCPDKSQVGTVTLHSSLGVRSFGLFNLTPPPGTAAELGFAPYGEPIAFIAHVRGEAGEYGLTMQASNFPQTLPLYGAEVNVWGTPWAISHDTERGNCLNEEDPAEPWGKCSVGPPRTNRPEAFLTLPASCAGPLAYTAAADSWQQPGTVEARTQTPALEGCEQIEFQTISQAQPTSLRASSATGFEFNLEVRQDGLTEPAGRQPSQVRDATVSLPEGMTINPSVGAGLGICTPAQLAAETAGSAPGTACPDESKIGDFRAESPLLEEAVDGGIFLAQPFQNPFGSLIGIYLVAKSIQRGILVKVAGKVEADPASGSLTATFDRLPQLPYSSLVIHFREGQRSPLATPASCGPHSTVTELSAWRDPTLVRRTESAVAIEAGVGGGPCPQGTPPFGPQATAGTLNSRAGAYSPFYLHLTRTDVEQEITRYSATLPPGLLGKIAGIPYCPDAAIAAASRRSGVEELEHPDCPAASKIGHTTAGYGVGSVLTYAPGNLYLAGPYHGSTISVVAIDSALVGPFDLGVVVVRSAIEVNPLTTQVSIDSQASDPIPHIRGGIPLHLRDIRVYISRPQFTINPTNCGALSADSTLTGSSPPFANPRESSATVASPFHVSNCSSLGFAPKLALKLLGSTKRNSFPALQATLTERPGDADIAGAAVALPHAEFLAQEHIDTVCTGKQFAAHSCPAGSIYGHARAFSPLLSAPLEGPVYLRSGSHLLPDLVVALAGDGGIEVNLEARVDSVRGGMRATFEALPDAPASKFVLKLFGGKRGLLVNSADVCKAPAAASARFVGQNNAGYAPQVALQNQCKKQKGKGHKKGKARRKHHKGKGR